MCYPLQKCKTVFSKLKKRSFSVFKMGIYKGNLRRQKEDFQKIQQSENEEKQQHKHNPEGPSGKKKFRKGNVQVLKTSQNTEEIKKTILTANCRSKIEIRGITE